MSSASGTSSVAAGTSRELRFERARLRCLFFLSFAAALMLLFWALWFLDRGSVATLNLTSYYDFENAFPVADAWLLVACVSASAMLLRRSERALFWLLVAGGATIYLAGMDVLYDLEHSIYTRGAPGLFELAINLVCLVGGATVLLWSWAQRDLFGPTSGI